MTTLGELNQRCALFQDLSLAHPLVEGLPAALPPLMPRPLSRRRLEILHKSVRSQAAAAGAVRASTIERSVKT